MRSRTASLVLVVAAVLLGTPAHAQRPGDVQRRLDDAWHRLEVVVEQYNDVREELAATRAKAADLDRRIAPLRAAVEAGEARLGGLAAHAYRSGGPARLGTLLAATSPDDFVERLMLAHGLARRQTKVLGSLTAVRRQHEQARAKLAALAADQARHQKELAEKKRRIEAEISELERLRGGVRRAHHRSRVPAGFVPAYAPGPAGKAIRFAQNQLGKPYRWGASGPNGYDCSGLTTAAWRAAGVRLPHNSARQWRAVNPVSRAELRPGDIVFYYADIHHVGLYVGDGKIIHAPGHGEPVRYDAVGYGPVYGYGRP